MGEAGDKVADSTASFCVPDIFLFLLVGECLECGEEGEKDDFIKLINYIYYGIFLHRL